MGIGEQFAGLDMANLIGGPLNAAADASVLLAQSTADFINKVGFDGDQNTRKVQFSYQRMEPDVDGSINQSEMKIDVPILAIVPIPNLQIDEVNILFDMEVKQCEKSEQTMGMSAKIEAGLQIGPVKVSITGSVSANSSNTRSSDNSAKYHVDIRATNHGTPEGLARVLDMMAANVAPVLVRSTAVDETGKELDAASKEKNLQLRTLREKKFQTENAVRAASDMYENKLKALLSNASSIEDNERLELAKPGAQEDSELESKASKISTSWDSFRSKIKLVVSAACGNAPDAEGNPAIEELDTRVDILMCAPYGDEANVANEKGTTAKKMLQEFFVDAVNSCKKLETATKAMEDNNNKYNEVMMS